MPPPVQGVPAGPAAPLASRLVGPAPLTAVAVLGVPLLPAAGATTVATRPAARSVAADPSARVAHPAPVTRPAVRVRSAAERVVREAAALRGRPHRYGAAGPRSFDCSGSTRFVFGAAVGRSLPYSSRARYAPSHKILKSQLRPGDLVFFVRHGHVYHVGINAGHGLISHAPHTGDRVRLARISTSSWVAGRVL
jgi:cell wall-associated NlpC family hydrolase